MFNNPRNRRKIIGIFFAAILTLPGSGYAATKHPVTLDDLLTIRSIGAVELSPTGNQMAYSVSGKLYICPIDNPADSKLLGTAMMPIWSPDGHQLAYYSDKSGTTQLWTYDLSSSRSVQITNVKGGIAPESAAGGLYGDSWRYSWSSDSTQIAFASQVSSPSFAISAEKNEPTKPGQPLILNNATPIQWTLSGVFVSAFDEPTVMPGTKPKINPPLVSELFIVNVSTNVVRQITSNDRGYFTPDWSPDGKSIVCATPNGKDMYGLPIDTTSILLLDIKTGKTKLLTNPIGNKNMPTWSPDGKEIAFFTGEHSGLQSINVLDLNNGTLHDLSRHLPVSIGMFRWTPDSHSIVGIAMNGVDWKVVRINAEQGDVHPLEKASPARRWFLSIANDGTVAWQESNGTHESIIRILHSGQDHSQLLFDANPQIENWELGKQEIVRWKGSDSEQMEGLLIKPVNYQLGKRYPLIVIGYPDQANRFMDYAMLGSQAWASMGYAIFYPNPSAPHVWINSFWTPAFDEMAKGPNGWEITTEQVLTGVDELIRRGIVDPNRMGLSGFSNGGAIVNALVTRTNRFRCAVSVAAVYPDLLAPFFLHSDSHIPNLFASGNPLDVPENYIRLSSVFRAQHVKTPMLIADGDLDGDFLLGSIEWYNALRWAKKDVIFLRYPGQGHGFNGASMRDFWTRENAFFAKYLQP